MEFRQSNAIPSDYLHFFHVCRAGMKRLIRQNEFKIQVTSVAEPVFVEPKEKLLRDCFFFGIFLALSLSLFCLVEIFPKTLLYLHLFSWAHVS